MAGVADLGTRGDSGAARSSWRSMPTVRRTSGGSCGSPTPPTGRSRSGRILHLPDVNPGLEFDRAAAAGCRLDIPAGTCIRFEPGASRTAGIVALKGRKVVPGIQLRPEPVEGPA